MLRREIRLHILIPPSGDSQHHQLIRSETQSTERPQRVRRLQRRDDPLQPRQLVSRLHVTATTSARPRAKRSACIGPMPG